MSNVSSGIDGDSSSSSSSSSSAYCGSYLSLLCPSSGTNSIMVVPALIIIEVLVSNPLSLYYL